MLNPALNSNGETELQIQVSDFINPQAAGNTNNLVYTFI